MDRTSGGSVGGQSQHDPVTLLMVWAMKDALAPRVTWLQGYR